MEARRWIWVPHIPGVDAPGRYADYAKDRWTSISQVFKKIEEGSYKYFYPADKSEAKAKKNP